MESYTFSDFQRDHASALTSMNVPERYWPVLHIKLLGKVFDASENFELGLLNYTSSETGEIVKKEHFVNVKVNRVSALDTERIFLLDHAWTYRMDTVRETLSSNPKLLARMANLMCISEDEHSEDNASLIEPVMRSMWKYCHLYQVHEEPSSDSDQVLIKMNVWYILDEIGSSIQQSCTPNVQIATFMYVPERLFYSVFWPIEDLHKDDTLSVDWLSGVSDSDKKALLLIPWEDCDVSDQSTSHNYILTDNFFGSHKIEETLPDPTVSFVRVLNNPLKVFTDLRLVAETLTSPSYEITVDRNEADILWLSSHIRNFRQISTETPSLMVNQFPNESILTVKDLLAALAASERAIEISGPGEEFETGDQDSPVQFLTCSWYPLTFNLLYELPQFVACFQRREKEAESNCAQSIGCCPQSSTCLRCDRQGRHVSTGGPVGKNVWIIKPWNLGRGLGISVTDNLTQILQLSVSGPLIASRYITDPVLFYRDDISSWVKFDVRYVVLLRSIEPLELFVHKVFWLRFANKEFSLDHFDEYSKHFTVMNYRDDELKQIHHHEFIEAFEKQYTNATWNGVEAIIHKTLVDIFTLASSYPHPRGLGRCQQSRAMYAVDLLLEWRRADQSHTSCFAIQPQICEINFIPDCVRACTYYPDFYNEIFDCLFLNRTSECLLKLP